MTEINEASSDLPDAYGAFIEDVKSQNLVILPDEQIRERIKRIRDNSTPEEEKKRLRNDVINSNLRLIPYLINRASNSGIPKEEMIGEAFETLNSCIDKFDPDFISPRTEDQVKFSTYVAASIESKLRSPQSVVRAGETFRIPAHVEDIANLMRRARELFMQEEHREPNDDEWYKRTVRLAGETRSIKTLKSVKEETFKAAKQFKLEGKARLGRKVGRGNVHTDTLEATTGLIEDTIIDEEEDTEEAAIREVLKEDADKALFSLSNRERTILEMRFGIGLNEEGKPKHPMTLEEVARVMGLATRERVRQIEATALRKLRHPSRSKYIKEYLYSEEEGKSKENESIYRNILVSLSNNLLERYDRWDVVHILAQIRNGDKETGRIDLELFSLSNLYRELLKEHEEKFHTSPRIFTKDILKSINENIGLLYQGYSWRDNPEATRYWSNQFPIVMEEVVKESEYLRGIT